MASQKVKREVTRYCFMVVGCLCYALAMNLFYVPNSIVAGGVVGMATLLNLITGVGVGVFSVLINLPILLLGLRTQGWRFIVRCFITNASLSLLIDLLSFLPAITYEPVMAAIYGGVLQGMGIGLFYRYNMSSGGTELLARVMLPMFPGLTMGTLLAVLDGLVVITGTAVLKNPENLLMALIVIFISAKVSDMIISGLNYAKMCYIITDRVDDVAKALLESSPRGVTNISGQGMYTKQSRNVLMTVVKKRELAGLRQVVERSDPRAFVIVSEATEVLGVGFQSISPKAQND